MNIIELNLISFVILLASLALWKIDFISTILNLGALKSAPPKELETVFDSDKYSKSQEYTRASSRFHLCEASFSLVLFFAFWLFGGFQLLDEWTREWSDSSLLRGISYIGMLAIGGLLISLPFELYSTFKLEEKFGFNRSDAKTFWTDQIKNLLLSIVLGGPILLLIIWIFELQIPFVWLWAWGAFTLVSLLLTYFAPSLILPLFNKFTPMEDDDLKKSIEVMAQKCEFPLTEIAVMDGSKRSTKSNAFFTGFGKRKKIALYDTLLEGQSHEELVGILAHEIGHFKKKHIIQRFVLSILQTGIVFYLLGLLIDPNREISQQVFAAFGLPATSMSVAAGLVFFVILFKPISFITGIAMNILSRKHEFEADAYAAEVQGTPEHLISALKKLSSDNLVNLTPHPFKVFLEYSHPPMLERIKMLRK